MISLLSQRRLHTAGQLNHLIYPATALWQRSCKKLKGTPPLNQKRIFTAFLLCVEAV